MVRDHVTAAPLLCFILPTAACGGRDIDTKLSDELAKAHLRPVAWIDDSGRVVPDESKASARHTCAIRLRDDASGLEFVLQRATAAEIGTQTDSGPPRHWHGDYRRIEPNDPQGLASHWVRIQCGTWKVLGLVPRRLMGRICASLCQRKPYRFVAICVCDFLSTLVHYGGA